MTFAAIKLMPLSVKRNDVETFDDAPVRADGRMKPVVEQILLQLLRCAILDLKTYVDPTLGKVSQHARQDKERMGGETVDDADSQRLRLRIAHPVEGAVEMVDCLEQSMRLCENRLAARC